MGMRLPASGGRMMRRLHGAANWPPSTPAAILAEAGLEPRDGPMAKAATGVSGYRKWANWFES